MSLPTPHWRSLAIIIICLTGLTQTLELAGWLRFDRNLIIYEHEIWRMLSASFIHLNWSHWMMNMLGLVLIWSLVGDVWKNWQWLVVIVFSSFFLGIGVLWLDPEVGRYVGLSGVLHALIIAGAIGDLRKNTLFASLVLLVVIGKLIWEIVWGALPGSEEMVKGPVLTQSHLYGGIAGALVVGGFKLHITLKTESKK